MSKWIVFYMAFGLLYNTSLPAQNGVISQAWYHQNTDEVSIHLRFWKDLEVSDDYSGQLINTTDSIIQDDDYQVRKRLSPIAFDYFDTTGYAHMWYFNEEHKLIGKLHFERFEYQEDELEAYFKAVFSVKQRKADAELAFDLEQYAISSPLLPYQNESFQSSAIHSEIQVSPSEEETLGFSGDEILEGSVIDWNGLNTLYVVTIGNYRQSEWDSKIISSTHPASPLFKDHSQFAFYSANALPLIINDYPILFCHKGKPDTDWHWSEFMYFNGTHYVTAKGGTILLQDN